MNPLLSIAIASGGAFILDNKVFRDSLDDIQMSIAKAGLYIPQFILHAILIMGLAIGIFLLLTKIF